MDRSEGFCLDLPLTDARKTLYSPLPQLSDFGLAIWAPTNPTSLTHSDVVGTFGYRTSPSFGSVHGVVWFVFAPPN
jgi:hypothetical protein